MNKYFKNDFLNLQQLAEVSYLRGKHEAYVEIMKLLNSKAYEYAETDPKLSISYLVVVDQMIEVANRIGSEFKDAIK